MKNQYKSKSSKQKLYKMKGCSSTRKNRYGGKGTMNLATQVPSLGADFNLAYPYKGPFPPNPALAYTGKGGKSNFFPLLENPSYLTVKTSNENGINPLYPNTGPPPNGFNFLNPLQQQKGGNCGCGAFPFMNGGGKNSKHRSGCKCSTCKKNMRGGGGCSTSNNGIPYPNGLVGKPFVDPINLPGAKGIGGDANYYSLNKYINDVSRQMIDVGANKPFLGYYGVKGGKRSHSMKKTKKQRGGDFSNFIGQDIINLGRQFTYGLGSAFNTLNGTPGPVNPLPWKGQLTQAANTSTLRNI
jgi:hypothetical protein